MLGLEQAHPLAPTVWTIYHEPSRVKLISLAKLLQSLLQAIDFGILKFMGYDFLNWTPGYLLLIKDSCIYLVLLKL